MSRMGAYMKKILGWIRLSFVAATFALVTGCNDSNEDADSSDGSSTNTTTATLSGAWAGTITQGGNLPANVSMGISQNGDALTGNYQGSGGVNGTITGALSGDAVSITTQAGGVTAQWTGTANAGRTSMSGTFSIIAGGGGNGTWSLTRQ